MILYLEIPVETPDEEILRDLTTQGYSVTTSVEQAIRLAEEHGVTLCRAGFQNGDPRKPVIETFMDTDEVKWLTDSAVEVRSQHPGLYREAPHARALDKTLLHQPDYADDNL